MVARHSDEIAKGERFAFGENWAQFLSCLNEERIQVAESSLLTMLGIKDLSGKRFLDVGCGSGLFSLAARRLGACVHSFDYDSRSVACANELKQRYFPDDPDWIIQEGSALNESYMKSLGQFDLVYSWGVLHHTGNMMQALRNVESAVRVGGLLFIAIYNEQGVVSKLWSRVKKTYCSGPVGKIAVGSVFIPYFILTSILLGLVMYGNPIGYFQNHKKKRGMSLYYDWKDWLGGYPFEVAKPEIIFLFYQELGFRLINLTTTNRLGCNQFVFERVAA